MPIPTLTKIAAPTAAEVCESFALQPSALELLTPEQTPTQLLEALQENQMSTDSINLLAHGMPEQEAVGWACKSTETVADKLGPADTEALEAAQAWVANPCEGTMEAASAAAAATDFQSPAAWAAQGAAWSPEASGIPAADIAVPAGLTGKAVAGSVMLAAALSVPGAPEITVPEITAPELPEVPSLDLQAPDLAIQAPEIPEVPSLEMTPKQQAAVAKIHQPYIDTGIEIASGQTPVA